MLVDRLRGNRLVSMAPVEAAMRAVPRHLFVPDAPAERAYADENIVTHRDADRIRAWDHDRQSMTALWIEVHPADTSDVPTGQVAIRKRHTEVIIRTALPADDPSGLSTHRG